MVRLIKITAVINVVVLILLTTAFGWTMLAQKDPLSAMAASFRPAFYTGQFATEMGRQILFAEASTSIPESEFRLLRGTTKSLVIVISGLAGDADNSVNDLLAAPGVRAGWTCEQFKFANVIPSLDTEGLKEFIATVEVLRARHQHVRILHSRDDFLNRPADIETLASISALGTVVLPDGGHIGGIFQESGQTMINRFFEN